MKNAWENYRENMNWLNLRRLANEAELARHERQRDRRAKMTPEERLAEDRAETRAARLSCGCLFVIFAAIAALIIWFVWESYF